MPSSDPNIAAYRELADWYDRQGQPQLRDRFLVLAADAAQTSGHALDAERHRQRLLQLSPHHMLRPFASFGEALRSPDVQSYLNDLRRGYPPATAEALLTSLRSGTGSEPGAAPPRRPAPDVDMELPLHETIDTTEALRVFSLAEEPEPSQPPAQPSRSPAPPRPPTRLVGRPSPASAPRSSPPPARAPIPARPEPPRPAAPVMPPPELEEERARRGNWVAVVLGVLVLLAGAALLVYTLARPFLHP